MFITDKVYLVEASKGAYVYALRLADGVTLIDTSFPGHGAQIAEELQAKQLDQVKHILLTHHDVDHIGNVAMLQQKYHCDVYISEIDMPYALGTKKRPGLKKIVSFLVKTVPPERLQALPSGNFAISIANSIPEIQIIPTPGHTPGHTCFLFDGVLLAGDSLNSGNGKLQKSPPVMSWDRRQEIASAKAMNSLKFDWVCPAHGKPVKTSKIEI